MKNFFNDIARVFVQYIDLKARQYTTEALDETRHIISGILILAVGGIFWSIALVFLFTGLFFRFSATLAEYFRPAVYTCLCSAAVAAILTWSGVAAVSHRRVSRARRYVPGDGGL